MLSFREFTENKIEEAADPKVHLKKARSAANRDEQELFVKHMINFHKAMKAHAPDEADKHDAKIKELKGYIGENVENVHEAEYQGRDVPLNKPMAGDVKKSKVFVKNAEGNVVKVNFGDKNMSIKKNIPARRKSFRARHNCDNPGPKTKARYWSCKAW